MRRTPPTGLFVFRMKSVKSQRMPRRMPFVRQGRTESRAANLRSPPAPSGNQTGGARTTPTSAAGSPRAMFFSPVHLLALPSDSQEPPDLPREEVPVAVGLPMAVHATTCPVWLFRMKTLFPEPTTDRLAEPDPRVALPSNSHASDVQKVIPPVL